MTFQGFRDVGFQGFGHHRFCGFGVFMCLLGLVDAIELPLGFDAADNDT